MNAQNLLLASQIVSKNYVTLASNNLNSRSNLIKVLLSQRCLPEDGWDDLSIEQFLEELAMMDTNNFQGKIGVGEREGRVFSNLVAKRHFYMAHGIGRSGDIRAEQPKACGSSLMLKLTEYLAKDALSICGYQNFKEVMVVPLATGMALSLVLSAIKSQSSDKKKYVLWSRIDQKTCLKCIYTSGLEAIVVETRIEGDSLKTDVEKMEEILKERKDEILCVLTTTSCFAPRVPDDLESVAKLCATYDIYHIVNNAYGLQCTKIANSVNMANKKGRLDCLVSSTDKNFLVPVGGALIYSRNKQVIQQVTSLYPGRASGAPILDLFITLLSMGKKTFLSLLQKRKENVIYLREKLSILANKFSERILITKDNSISTAMTLSNFIDAFKKEEKTTTEDHPINEQGNSITQLGSVLYIKRIMGSRVICESPAKSICGKSFMNYGSNSENYPFLPYMTVACAIGMTIEEIDQFVVKLGEVLSSLKSSKQIPPIVKNDTLALKEQAEEQKKDEEENEKK